MKNVAFIRIPLDIQKQPPYKLFRSELGVRALVLLISN